MKEENQYLHERLTEYKELDIYPFHMPGHKRNVGYESTNPYLIDMTEVEGVDNLHDPKEVLLLEKRRIARLYGAKESYILVGGSTTGNLAAIYASTKDNGSILIQRNSHKSVYHGAMLAHQKVSYIFPRLNDNGIYDAVTPEEVKKALKENTGVNTVVITSPTYEGNIADIRRIADICHENDSLLIVDCAHGAHLGFVEDKNPVTQGADIVIMSLHKTLPALTQTAVLHVCSNRISPENIQKALDIFETSSPSYVLMDSISCCMKLMEKKGYKLIEEYDSLLNEFYDKCNKLKTLSVEEPSENRDKGKIVIHTNGSLTGPQLAEALREKYRIETEMAGAYYVLCMTSISDTKEGFNRLIEALYDIDGGNRRTQNVSYFETKDIIILESMSEARNNDTNTVKISDAAGKEAAEEICIYPPGSPIVMPGEEITEDIIDIIEKADMLRLQVTGIHDGCILVADSNSMNYTFS